jgi:hypothetical protein
VLQLPDLAERIDGFARLTTQRNRLIGPLLRAVEGAATAEPGARERRLRASSVRAALGAEDRRPVRLWRAVLERPPRPRQFRSLGLAV